jgi:hypothetical protein
MSFVISKVFWTPPQPSNPLLLAAGLAALFVRSRPVIATPVDFRRPQELNARLHLSMIAQSHVSDRLSELDDGVKVWIGLIAYWLMERTNALLPGP